MSWAGNTNDTVILDSLNQKFAVARSDRSLVYGEKEITLSGAKVDSDGNLTYNGKVIGAVTAVTSTLGNKIASFTCTDSSRMTISITSDKWFYSCAGVANTVTTTTAIIGSSGSTTSGTSSAPTVEAALQCITVDRQQGKLAVMTNTCNYDIEVQYCYAGSSDCKFTSWGVTSQSTIRAGRSHTAVTAISNSSAYTLRYIACKGANTSPREISETEFMCKP